MRSASDTLKNPIPFGAEYEMAFWKYGQLFSETTSKAHQIYISFKFRPKNRHEFLESPDGMDENRLTTSTATSQCYIVWITVESGNVLLWSFYHLKLGQRLSDSIDRPLRLLKMKLSWTHFMARRWSSIPKFVSPVPWLYHDPINPSR